MKLYTSEIVEDLRDEMSEDRAPARRYVTCSFQGMRAVLDDLDAYEALLREIVAYFEVIAQKYEGNTIVTSEWPIDWLRRARESREKA